MSLYGKRYTEEKMDYVIEPEKKVKICAEADLFVAGGSCTGLFAAVQAARRGLKVVLAERLNCLGGTATAALVNVWHSFKDAEYKERIIAGLTAEVTERLASRGAAVLRDKDPSTAVVFNPFELSYELDKLVKENKIKLYLHTMCVGAVCDGKRITHALIENKDGRSAVKADFYIDATGDGDLARFLGMSSYRHDTVQPPTPCFHLKGDLSGVDVAKLITDFGKNYGLPDDFGWSSGIPMIKGTEMMAYFHVFGEDCASADGLTETETEGRRKFFELVRLLNDHTDRDFSVSALPSYAGIRESRHFDSVFRATKDELLSGKEYEDTVLKGTYRIDTHDEKGDIVHMYLDGTAMSMSGAQRKTVVWNWREEKGISGDAPKYYTVPFRLLVQNEFDNIITAGRMLNADREAFGALRVMVNLNQLGEAAGTAAFISCNDSLKVSEIDGREVRRKMREAGCAV